MLDRRSGSMPGLLGYKVSRRLRAELQIAAAMARERIVETHVRQLLELIQIAERQLAHKRTIEIYVRLHSVDQETARLIGSMALATLGRRREIDGTIRLDAADTDPAPASDPDAPRSLLGQLRRRLRGRVYHDLRQRIELHTGRTNVAFLHIHLENALRFVQILTPHLSTSTAVELYTELVKVRRSMAEVIYFLVLDRLSGDAARWPEGDAGQPAAPPPPPVEQHALRIVNTPR
jgi:hypothetical protein